MNRGKILASFEPLFKPKNIAFAGLSPNRITAGNVMLQNIIEFGFAGNIYPIHKEAEMIQGYKAYKSVKDVPGDIDYFYVAIPAGGIADLVADCKDKVKFMHILTSGFSETGTEGKELEKSIKEKAVESNVRLIGPNCIGMYSPAAKITCIAGAKKEAGKIGVVSQSGGIVTDLIRRSNVFGLSFSKVISIGNSVDLNPADFLEYFEHDPETEIIGLYLEDVKEGARFIRCLRRVAVHKPVVILKGGSTPQGQKAASSHTGAIAEDIAVWNAICRQFGVASVDTLEEFVNTLLAFDRIKKMTNNNVLLVGPGGGATVTACDAAARSNFSVPRLDSVQLERLEELKLPPGTTIANPIDVPVGALVTEEGLVLKKIIQIGLDNNSINTVLVHLNIQNILSFIPSEELGLYVLDNLLNSVKLLFQEADDQNVILVLRSSGELHLEKIRQDRQKEMLQLGMPVYYSLHEAFESLAHVMAYADFKERRDVFAAASL